MVFRALFTATLLTGHHPLLAQEAATEQFSPEETDDEREGRGYWNEHFSLHGFLSVAYGDSDPGALLSGDSIFLGVPEDGIADYRIAAFQLRYDSGRHAAVLQLSHRKLGDSPLSDLENDVELDWLFYELDLTESTSVRLGRFPAMIGIFNEYRDVGVLLPFFRPAFLFYREGSVFSETIDGIGVIYRAFQDTDWPLEAEAYYGSFDVIEQPVTGFHGGLTEIKAKNSVGFQVWLTTPLESLRVGVGAQRWDLPAESSFLVEADKWQTWYTSIDAAFGRWMFRGEYRYLDLPIDIPPAFTDSVAIVDAYYLQLGFEASEKWKFFLQTEAFEPNQTGPTIEGEFNTTNRRDDAISVVYAPRPNVVLKAEYHEVYEGNNTVEPVFLPTGPPAFRFGTIDNDSSYSILSLSLSF